MRDMVIRVVEDEDEDDACFGVGYGSLRAGWLVLAGFTARCHWDGCMIHYV